MYIAEEDFRTGFFLLFYLIPSYIIYFCYYVRILFCIFFLKKRIIPVVTVNFLLLYGGS